jgi:hypothetical protein
VYIYFAFFSFSHVSPRFISVAAALSEQDVYIDRFSSCISKVEYRYSFAIRNIHHHRPKEKKNGIKIANKTHPYHCLLVPIFYDSFSIECVYYL